MKKPSKTQPDRKTEALSIRIDPRMRYGLELLARKQRRAVTGVVEWAIDKAFGDEVIDCADGSSLYFRPALEQLWATNEIERLVLLATTAPQLLTFEESRVWQVIRQTDLLWFSPSERSASAFKTEEVLSQWERLAPVIYEAADQPIIRGIMKATLKAGGVDVESLEIPF